ncbi:MAG: metal-dependent hydrolase, partial [Gammaproteobacteria bacterium]
MDTLTHALSGALMAHAMGHHHHQSKALTGGRAALVGFAAAAFPDVDFVLKFVDPLLYLNAHRGVTHSIIMLPLWALLLAWLFAKIYRSQAGGWRAFVGICAAAIGIHIAGDTITSYGTQLFAPFSNWKAAINTTFIIDLWFTGIILLSLVIALWRKAPLISRAGLACLAAYVGFQGIQEWRALDIAEDYRTAQGLEGYEVEALPQPASPFRWKLMVSDGERHHYAYLDLRKTQPPPTGDGYFDRLSRSYDTPTSLTWGLQTLSAPT